MSRSDMTSNDEHFAALVAHPYGHAAMGYLDASAWQEFWRKKFWQAEGDYRETGVLYRQAAEIRSLYADVIHAREISRGRRHG